MFISFGLVLSLPYNTVEKIRTLVEENGAKIIFETTSADSLFVLREYQVRRILQGDTSQLRKIYERKTQQPSEIRDLDAFAEFTKERERRVEK